MPIKTKKWDVVNFLKTPDDMAAYLEAALEENDPAFFAVALGDVARARGMTDVARQAGVSRESLYRSLSADGNPEFATIVKVMGAMGLRMSVVASDGELTDAGLQA